MSQAADDAPIRDILILGGSYTGISTAHHLLKHALPALPTSSAYRIILVSASMQAMCRPACPRAIISDDMFPQDKLFVDIDKQFAEYDQQKWVFVQGTVTQVDHEKRVVQVKMTKNRQTQDFDFHALVVATGASTPSPLLGLNTDETALREAWTQFRTALGAAKSIVIAGGGPTGVEIAGELGEQLNGKPGWFASKPAKPKVAITLVTSGADILPQLKPAIAKTGEQYLTSLGVTVVKNTRVESASPPNAGLDMASLGSKATLTLSNGSTLEADVYIPATGSTPNTSFMSPALLGTDGRIKTNPQTLRVHDAGPRIYAAGDVSSFARPAIINILAAIPVLAANIKRDLLLDADAQSTSAGEDKLYKEDTRDTQLVPIGRSKGVGAAMGWRLPSTMVYMIKGRDYWLWTTDKLWSGRQWAKAA